MEDNFNEQEEQPLDVEKELELEDGEIKDFATYAASVKEVSAQTKQDIIALMEILAEAPKIGKELLVRKKEQAKEAIDKTIQNTKSKFKAAMKSIKSKMKDYKNNVKDGMQDVKDEEKIADFEIGKKTAEGDRADQEWGETKKEDGKSGFIVDSVVNRKQESRASRAQMARGAVKVTGFIGKGLVLIGKSGLAKSMVEKVTARGEDFVGKESRIGQIMQRTAEHGFVIGDKIKNTVKDTVDRTTTTVKAGVEVAKDKAVELGRDATEKVKTTAKKGAIALGKATYKTAGIALGIGSFAVEKGKAATERVVNATKEKIIEPGKEMIGKTAETGSKFWDFAKAKLQQVRNVPTNLKERSSNLLFAMSEKIAPTMSQKAAVEERNQIAAQKGTAAREAFNNLTGKEDKSDDGSR